MNFLDILPSLGTLALTTIGGIISFNKQQARFQSEIDLMKQTMGSEKERLQSEIVAIKVASDHLARTVDNTKEELSIFKGDIRSINTKLEFILDAVKEIRDKQH
jgi:hypothetical protein